MCVSGAATASRQHHCLSRHWNFYGGKQRASAQVRGVKADSVSASPSRTETALYLFGPRWEPRLSSASDVLGLEAKSVTEGACAQRCALCQRATERLRCVVTWRKNKTGGTLNLSPLVSGRGAEGSGPVPVGVQLFQLLMLIGVVRKVVFRYSFRAASWKLSITRLK